MHRLTFILLAALVLSTATLSADDQAVIDTLRDRAAGGDVKAQLDLAIRHRDGKAEGYMDVGEAMGRAMVELLKK